MKRNVIGAILLVSVSALCFTNHAKADSKVGQKFVGLWRGPTSLCENECGSELLSVEIPVPHTGTLSPAFGDVEIKLTVFADMRSLLGFINIDIGDQGTRLTPSLPGVLSGPANGDAFQTGGSIICQCCQGSNVASFIVTDTFFNNHLNANNILPTKVYIPVGATSVRCVEEYCGCSQHPGNSTAGLQEVRVIWTPALTCDPPDCNDGNPCTDDFCNGGTGVCEHTNNTASCDDGLFCNGVETCVGGTCRAGTAVNCNDGVSCTNDSCNETTDSCNHIPSNALCNNGLFCDGVETCHVTLDCQAGTAVNCGDAVGCTDDSCNETTDSCDNIPNNAACDDGLFCNGIETCHATNDCISTGDPCGGPLPPICDEAGDSCVDCLLPVGFPGTTYACDDSLSRMRRNVLRYQFACPITLPLAGDLEIRELLPNGAFEADLSDRFDFSLEGPAGFETILRIEEDGCRGGTCDFGVSPSVCKGGQDDGADCGQVFVNETWYAVLNSGNWAGVANFQVDYASVYGDANNFGGTDFNDLNAIFSNFSNPPNCPDDSRFDINAFGCVDFNDLNAAFAYIGSAAPAKPSGHDCPGSSQQSQGGGSGTLDTTESLTTAVDDSLAIFVAWFPDFVSELEAPESERYDSLDQLLRKLVTWAVENLTSDQRDTVASALSDPLRTFADPIVAAKAQDMASAIAP